MAQLWNDVLLLRDNQVHPAAVKILRRGLLPGRRHREDSGQGSSTLSLHSLMLSSAPAALASSPPSSPPPRLLVASSSPSPSPSGDPAAARGGRRRTSSSGQIGAAAAILVALAQWLTLVLFVGWCYREISRYNPSNADAIESQEYSASTLRMFARQRIPKLGIGQQPDNCVGEFCVVIRDNRVPPVK